VVVCTLKTGLGRILSAYMRLDLAISDALDRFLQQPDCFGLVGRKIRSQCASLEHHQDERVAGDS
jgi:hypothetical protein